MKKDKSSPPQENMYDEMRQMSLNITPDQLELKLPSNKTVVYGIVLDWNMGVNVVTLVSFQTGDASIYLSSGGAVIGGVNHESVYQAAKNLVADAQNFLSPASETEKTPLPKLDQVKFYFLTNKGKYVASERMKNFENNTSPLLDLFISANVVITELRELAEKG